MGNELAAVNVTRSHSLAATCIAIFTFTLFFMYPMLMAGRISPFRYHATLVVLGVATFAFVLASLSYYCVSAGGFGEKERARYSRRGDRFWLAGSTLLFLDPSLILFTVGLRLPASAWLGLWLTYVLFVARCFPRLQEARP